MLEELGQIELTIGERVYQMSPNYKGLMYLEQASGKSITKLVNEFGSGDASITDVVNIVYAGLLGAHDGRPGVTIEFLGNEVLRHGFQKLLDPCGQFLLAAHMGKSIAEVKEIWGVSPKKKQDLMKAPEQKEAKTAEGPNGAST